MTSNENPYQAALTDAIAPAQSVARRQLLPVAIGLLVTSILHVAGYLYYAAYVYIVVAAPNAEPSRSHPMIVYCLFYGISVFYCLLLIMGAFSMMRQGSYLWAMTTCILAMIPLLGPCYFFAVPFGIWGLLVLKRPEVRDSFARS
jgi:hypothetical protein